MTTIQQSDLIESVAAALQYISYYHTPDFIQHMARAYEREQSPAAKDAIAQILTNSRMCAEGHRPICQDTGIVNLFLKVGMDVRWDAKRSLAEMVNEGVRRAYSHPDNTLRASVVETLRPLRVSGVRLSVSSGRAPIGAILRFGASGRFADVMRTSGQLIRPGSGLALQRVSFSPGAAGTVTLDLEGGSLGEARP